MCEAAFGTERTIGDTIILILKLPLVSVARRRRHFPIFETTHYFEFCRTVAKTFTLGFFPRTIPSK